MFFSKTRDYINESSLKLIETPFATFVENIKDTEFEKIIQLWISDDGYGHSLLLHFIDLFYPITNITVDSLGEYFKTAPENITARIKGHERWNYPYTVNSLIEKLNILI